MTHRERERRRGRRDITKRLEGKLTVVVEIYEDSEDADDAPPLRCHEVVYSDAKNRAWVEKTIIWAITNGKYVVVYKPEKEM